MKNKNYRQSILLIFLYLLSASSLVIAMFLPLSSEKIFLIVGSIIIAIFAVIINTFYFSIKERSIIVRQGVFSTNKKYRSNFKKRVFSFEEIATIKVDCNNQNYKIIMNLVDGNVVGFSFMGCLKKKEIIKTY